MVICAVKFVDSSCEQNTAARSTTAASLADRLVSSMTAGWATLEERGAPLA